MVTKVLPLVNDGRSQHRPIDLDQGEALSGATVQLSADASNLLKLGSDGGLYVVGASNAVDSVGYLTANGMAITKNVAWGMGGPTIKASSGRLSLGASVTVGDQQFTLLRLAQGTYDIEMSQNWQWLSGPTSGNAAGSSVNLMKFTLSPDLFSVLSISSMGVYQSLFANANTVQQVAQRSLFRDIAIDANPLIQYGLVAQFINGQASQSASLSGSIVSIDPASGSVNSGFDDSGIRFRFMPK